MEQHHEINLQNADSINNKQQPANNLSNDQRNQLRNDDIINGNGEHLNDNQDELQQNAELPMRIGEDDFGKNNEQRMGGLNVDQRNQLHNDAPINNNEEPIENQNEPPLRIGNDDFRNNNGQRMDNGNNDEPGEPCNDVRVAPNQSRYILYRLKQPSKHL